MRLLRTVGLAEKALNYPDELSGGFCVPLGCCRLGTISSSLAKYKPHSCLSINLPQRFCGRKK